MTISYLINNPLAKLTKNALTYRNYWLQDNH